MSAHGESRKLQENTCRLLSRLAESSGAYVIDIFDAWICTALIPHLMNVLYLVFQIKIEYIDLIRIEYI